MAKKPQVIWDNYRNLGEIRKSDSLKLNVDLVARGGVKYLSIREWYKKKGSDEFRPSAKGVVIPIKVPVEGKVVEPLSALSDYIAHALSTAEDFSIEDEENKVWSEPK